MGVVTYIPSESGWATTPSGYGGYIRIKVDRTYNESTNQSTCVISMEGYATMLSLSLQHNSGTFSVNGQTLLSGNTGYALLFNQDSTWRPLTNNGSTATWTVTVNHDDDGTATIPFVFSSFNLYRYYNGNWNMSLTASETKTYTEDTNSICIGVNGVTKRGKLYIGVNGVPKKAKLYIGVNGVPKKAK